MAGIGVVGVAGLMLAGTASAYAGTGAATTVTVRQVDLVGSAPGPGEFAVINQGDGGGKVQIVSGPATPPLGTGSLAMSVTGTGDHWSVYTDDWADTPLSALTGISYSTYTDNTTTAPPSRSSSTREPRRPPARPPGVRRPSRSRTRRSTSSRTSTPASRS